MTKHLRPAAVWIALAVGAFGSSAADNSPIITFTTSIYEINGDANALSSASAHQRKPPSRLISAMENRK